MVDYICELPCHSTMQSPTRHSEQPQPNTQRGVTMVTHGIFHAWQPWQHRVRKILFLLRALCAISHPMWNTPTMSVCARYRETCNFASSVLYVHTSGEIWISCQGKFPGDQSMAWRQLGRSSGIKPYGISTKQGHYHVMAPCETLESNVLCPQSNRHWKYMMQGHSGVACARAGVWPQGSAYMLWRPCNHSRYYTN